MFSLVLEDDIGESEGESSFEEGDCIPLALS